MKKSPLLAGFVFLATLLTTSCQYEIYHDLSFKVIAPIGAPTMALFTYFDDQNYTISNKTTTVQAAFASTEYDAIIFDSLAGYKQIKTKNLDFKLAQIITTGNFYLLDLNKDREVKEIQDSDLIVAFGENGTPGTVFKAALPELATRENTKYITGGVTEMETIVRAGKYENQDVDYALLSEPYITKLQDINATYPTKGKIAIEYNLQREFTNKTGIENFPQAGLFIRTSTYTEKKDDVDEMLKVMRRNLKDLKNGDLEDVYPFLTAISKEESEQIAAVGLGIGLLGSCQKISDNNLGYTTGLGDLSEYYQYLVDQQLLPGAIGVPATDYYLENYK